MSRSPKRARPRDLLVAESETMRAVVAAVEACAESDSPVLIEGEPGSGRELIARLIHLAGPRRDRTLVSVRAGVAPKEIFTDEIEGASNSSFRTAQGGSLLVKQVCELSRTSQRKLNKVLRPVSSKGKSDSAVELYDVRILATTDPDLSAAVEAEVFNRTLYSRLSKTTIVVPPLRERAPDIAPLAAQLIREYGRELGRKRMSVSTRAYDRLVTYPWPGNVAELKAVTRRLVVRAAKSRIESGDVEAVLPVVAERVPMEQMSFEEMVRSKLAAFLRRVDGYPIAGMHEEVIARVERPLLDLVMEHTGGNQVKAAEILGLNRNTLRRKLSDHGIHARTKAASKRRNGEARKRAGT